MAVETGPIIKSGPQFVAIFKSLVYSSFSIYPRLYRSEQYLAPRG